MSRTQELLVAVAVVVLPLYLTPLLSAPVKIPGKVAKSLKRECPTCVVTSVEEHRYGKNRRDYDVTVERNGQSEVFRFDQDGDMYLDLSADSRDTNNAKAIATHFETPGMMSCNWPGCTDIILESAMVIFEKDGQSAYRLTIAQGSQEYIGRRARLENQVIVPTQKKIFVRGKFKSLVPFYVSNAPESGCPGVRPGMTFEEADEAVGGFGDPQLAGIIKAARLGGVTMRIPYTSNFRKCTVVFDENGRVIQ